MFKLKKPCKRCPFRKGQGELFNLGTDRCLEIFNSDAFQCHETVDYGHFEDERLRQGKNPQQCAGVMSLLHRANLPNQIMRVAERLGAANFAEIDHRDVYGSIADAIEAHSVGRNWAGELASFKPEPTTGQATRARMPNFARAWQR